MQRRIEPYVRAPQTRLSGQPAGSVAAAAPSAVSPAPAPGPSAAQPAASRAVAGCSITAPAGSGGGESIAAYDADVMPVLERFIAAASSLGEDVAKPSSIVRDAFAGAFQLITRCARTLHLRQQGTTTTSARTGKELAQDSELIGTSSSADP